jgi:thiamine-monophosphate kinase
MTTTNSLRPEFELIAAIRQRASVHPPVMLGIGDDAAVLAPTPGKLQVVTTDLLTEGVDFRWPEASAWQIGRKVVLVNLSDIAAMGAWPVAAWVASALPADRGEGFAREFHAGVLAAAEEFGVTLAGGDTNTWPQPFVVAMTVLGEVLADRPVLRSGAQAGDWVVVTGAFGGSLLGRHLEPAPRLREVRRMVELAEVHALIDVSDGLAADLHHLLEESRVGATIVAADVPVHADAFRMGDGISPLEHALSDGEDFELIATLAPEQARRLLALWDLETPLTKIGEITAETGCRLMAADGVLHDLPPRGWCHAWQTASAEFPAAQSSGNASNGV